MEISIQRQKAKNLKIFGKVKDMKKVKAKSFGYNY